MNFQQNVATWARVCFGEAHALDIPTRNHRFLEEALELVQAGNCTQEDAHALVDYVYGRPVGDPTQEVGGVLITLAALCTAQAIDMEAAGDLELQRVWQKIEVIRAKQAAKTFPGPLPGLAPAQPPNTEAEMVALARARGGLRHDMEAGGVELAAILDGIDRTEGEDGWWETSVGAEFGAAKGAALEALVLNLEKRLAREKERADFAWKNVHILERAYQAEAAKNRSNPPT